MSTTQFRFSPDIHDRILNLDVTQCFLTDRGKIIGNGAYADVWLGQLARDGRRPIAVAVKLMRFHLEGDIKNIFEREIYAWSKLRHRNVLQLIGYAFERDTGYPLLISRWMRNGSAWLYVTANGQRNPFHLVVGIARGLHYMHSQRVIHSDIKAVNILMSASDPPEPVICDFGCARIVHASLPLGHPTISNKGTVNWLAYELLKDWDKGVHHTYATDVWAFGMAVYELLERETPYKNYDDMAVRASVTSKKFPIFRQGRYPYPNDQSPLLKEIIKSCWDTDPVKRITMEGVLAKLKASPLYKEISRADGRIDDDDPGSQLLMSVRDLKTYADFASEVYCTCFSSDGKYLAVRCRRSVHIYNTDRTSSEKPYVLELPDSKDSEESASMAFIDPTGSIGFCLEGEVKSWCFKLSARKTKTSRFYKANGTTITLIACEGMTFACALADGTAHVFRDKSVRDDESRLTLRNVGMQAATGISINGALVAIACSICVEVWDVSDDNPILVSKVAGPVRAIAFAPIDKRIITTSGNLIKLWDISRSVGTEVRKFVGHMHNVTSIAVSFNGQWLMGGARDGTVRFWWLETSEAETESTIHGSEIVSTVFYPEKSSKVFVTASRDGQVKLREVYWEFPPGPASLH